MAYTLVVFSTFSQVADGDSHTGSLEPCQVNLENANTTSRGAQVRSVSLQVGSSVPLKHDFYTLAPRFLRVVVWVLHLLLAQHS